MWYRTWGHVTLVADFDSIARSPATTRRDAMDTIGLLQGRLSAALAKSGAYHIGVPLRAGITLFNMLLAQSVYRTGEEITDVALYNRCRERFLVFLAGVPRIIRESLLQAHVDSTDLKGMLTTVA